MEAESGLEPALLAANALLHLGAALLAGASLATPWLLRGSSAWSAARAARVRRWTRTCALLALAAAGAVLWLQSAAMAEVLLARAWPAVGAMLGATHYGAAWRVGAGALLLALALAWLTPRRHARAGAHATLGLLAVFWYTRSMVGHASRDGDFSVALLADWLHLALASAWIGMVALAAAVTLGGAGPEQASGRRERAACVASLSGAATVALAGLFATGLLGAWRNLDSAGALLDTPYGRVLLAKLALVGVAALLGACNRFLVMPAWLASEGAGRAAPGAAPLRFRRVLLLETAVLALALALATLLAATAPPEAAAAHAPRLARR